MEWQFADVFSDGTGAEVHLYELVDTATGIVLDEKYVSQDGVVVDERYMG